MQGARGLKPGGVGGGTRRNSGGNIEMRMRRRKRQKKRSKRNKDSMNPQVSHDHGGLKRHIVG